MRFLRAPEDRARLRDREAVDRYNDHARMRISQRLGARMSTQGGEEKNSHSFQADEQPFVVDQRPAVPVAQLVDPIYTPDDDQ